MPQASAGGNRLVTVKSVGDGLLMSKGLRWLFTIACVASLTGCIEFERQTVSYRYDAKSDTIRFFQHYQGIFGASNTDELSDEEQSQLNSVLTTERTFFFSNWVFEFNRETIREWLAELKTPEGLEKFKGDVAALPRLEKLLKLVLDSVRVENVGFHIGDGGKLCGAQRVTMKNASQIITAANEVIRDAYKQVAAKPETAVEERAILEKSVARQQAYIALDGNRLRVRLPVTRTDYDREFSPDAKPSKQVGELVQSGGSLAFDNNELIATFGGVKDDVTTLTLSMSEKQYVSNLLEVVKRKPGLKGAFDVKAAVAEFLAAPKSEGKKGSP